MYITIVVSGETGVFSHFSSPEQRAFDPIVSVVGGRYPCCKLFPVLSSMSSRNRGPISTKPLSEGNSKFYCVFFFHPTRELFTHNYGDVIITDEWLQILTYTRLSWPLSSEGFSRTVTRDISLQWLSPRTRDTSTYCRSFSSGVGFEHPTFHACDANALTGCAVFI